MNYLHAFHAGNFADVFKHAMLVGLIETLKAKPTPFSYVETHAGAGRYELNAAEANRTNEYQNGILRLIGADNPANGILSAYLDLVRTLNPIKNAHELGIYPGSPLLVSLLMRDGDHAHLCELQPNEATKLKALFQNDRRIQVHARDGYAALKALLPPKPARGLVLIDPPFEAQENEFRAIEAALETGRTRWPTGIYAIWYPIKLRQSIKPFHRWLQSCGLKKILAAELLLHPDNSGLRLNGCGMIIINTPWQFDQRIEPMMPVLTKHLAQNQFGQYSIEWLARE